MQRKKLKNRVAAQTSRDRKKARMDEMEHNIKQLMEANEKLTSEVASLKALNERTSRVYSSAEGGPPAGGPRGAPAACGDVAPLADILAHLDSDEYLDTLHQLADSLLREIDEGAAGEARNVAVEHHSEPTKGGEVVGPAAEQLEPGEGAVADQLRPQQLDHKHDVHRILSHHSYAHPYTAEHGQETNDKGDLFYASCDDENDCVTVEVPCEQEVVEEAPITVQTDFSSLTDCGSGVTLECDMKLLSPMSLSPSSVEENLLGVSPAHTLGSDTGYESLASPLSESESLDLSDFWCESLSELFPGLA
ncbi:basic region leucine zipper domain-containing protein [Phthorimaea operculella]|nr:basic region leucine zipper domain-containing protein [Phthorimaea operculella]